MIDREKILKRIETEPFVPECVAAAYMKCSRNRFEEVYKFYIQPIINGNSRTKLYCSAELKNLPNTVKKQDPPTPKPTRSAKLYSLNMEQVFIESYRAAGLSEEQIQAEIQRSRQRSQKRRAS